MNIPTAWRGYIYIAAIIGAVCVGVAVTLGYVTADAVAQGLAVVTALVGALARANLSDTPQ